MFILCNNDVITLMKNPAPFDQLPKHRLSWLNLFQLVNANRNETVSELQLLMLHHRKKMFLKEISTLNNIYIIPYDSHVIFDRVHGFTLELNSDFCVLVETPFMVIYP